MYNTMKIFIYSLACCLFLFFVSCNKSSTSNEAESVTGEMTNVMEDDGDPLEDDYEETGEEFDISSYSPLQQSLLTSLLVFEGTIDDQYSINMVLGGLPGWNNDFEVVGRYAYQGKKNDLFLAGKLTEGRLVLEERNAKGKLIATFEGVLTVSSFTGKWKGNDKELDFIVNINTQNDYLILKGMNEYDLVKDKHMRELLAFCTLKKLPLVGDYPEGTALPFHLIRHFFDDQWLREDLEAGSYYGMSSYLTAQYIGLVYQYHYEPGVMGISNSTRHLTTYSFDGEKISGQITIDGWENDDNFGEEEYSTAYSAEISSDQVVVSIVKEHTIMDENREVSSNERLSERTIKYQVTDKGVIEEVVGLSEIFATIMKKDRGSLDGFVEEGNSGEIDGEEFEGVFTGRYYGGESEYSLKKLAPNIYSIIGNDWNGDCLGDNELTVYQLDDDGSNVTTIELKDIEFTAFWGDQEPHDLAAKEKLDSFLALNYRYEGEQNSELRAVPTLWGDDYCFSMAIGDDEGVTLDDYRDWLEMRMIESFTLKWNEESGEMMEEVNRR